MRRWPLTWTRTQRRSWRRASSGSRPRSGSFADIGAALKEIRDGKLYLLTHKTFADYVSGRWDIDRTYAHRVIEAAEVVRLMLPIGNKKCPPPAIESHARALVPVPVHLRSQVWESVWQAAGGRPTAKAVEAAARQAARDYEALKPATAEEKAVSDAAYLPYAGEDGDFHAGMAAAHEAVRRYREEHGLPVVPGEPEPAPVPDAGPGEEEPAAPGPAPVAGSSLPAPGDVLPPPPGSQPAAAETGTADGHAAAETAPGPQEGPQPESGELEALRARVAQLEKILAPLRWPCSAHASMTEGIKAQLWSCPGCGQVPPDPGRAASAHDSASGIACPAAAGS